MAIINNLPCPMCQKNGHDKSGNHLMVFDDGAGYCNRGHFHDNGRPYYHKPEGGIEITELPINGNIKYTPAQFKELEKEGKIADPKLRAIALGGMRMADRWEVMNEQERAEQKAEWELDVEWFNTLKRKNLISRHIRGDICALYDVRVGHDEEGKVNRHYYPRYEQGKLVGAKCRTLPKDFRFGHLGKLFGDQDLFGMHTMTAFLDKGRRKDTLLIVGGELDALASQQMLLDSAKGTQWEGKPYHVWSINKGEACLQEIVANREHISQFKKIIWGFDNDEVGMKLNQQASRLFAGKSYIIEYPSGCKDANKALMAGKHKEFVDAWFNAKSSDEVFASQIKSIASQRDKLKEARPEQGLSWPWPKLNKITLGIRKNQLIVIGAGSGVGKTEFLREVVKHLIEEHGESVGIISTEDPYNKVARAFIGKWIDKRIELPPCNNPREDGYREVFDYTEEEANAAIDYVADTGKLFVADLEGDYSMEKIEQTCLEFEAMGISNIIIDNLTGIKLDERQFGGKVGALDECVKRIGTIKDRHKVTIFLVSHLTRVSGQRTPHEAGGDVFLSDFRGSGAIGFWASYAIGIKRNTMAESLDERTTTFISCVKDRDQGIYTGTEIMLKGDLATGRLVEPQARVKSFDTGVPKEQEVPELETTIEENKQDEIEEF
ncbi:DNA primase [Proteus phage Premi]|uniref:DNA primase/helicase n=2 Tax=Acadevirus TaxID=2732918 RepID=A0A0G2SS09_9CAUD|nr:DNA primase/helicase [Proteus phage vB_PmiP_Pm5460]AKA61819.1 DNA primase/helicase [Proteus phage vB_PmiP_Pm5460]WQZ01153.1 DNA primase [Proteus phage Premi]